MEQNTQKMESKNDAFIKMVALKGMDLLNDGDNQGGLFCLALINWAAGSGEDIGPVIQTAIKNNVLSQSDLSELEALSDKEPKAV